MIEDKARMLERLTGDEELEARGKTHLALTFGKRNYKNTVFFNVEDSREFVAIFDRDLNPERIVAELAEKAARLFFRKTT